jgi:methionyl-tRNA formyltransferase
MRFLFFGTPDYTTVYLDCLAGLGSLVGIVTAPDRPAGRGRGIHRPGPAIWADEHDIPSFQPESPRDPALVSVLAPLKADLGIVVAYGRILPASIFTLPRLETINLHFSLLPAFRGAAPIEAALFCGAAQTGVSVQRIVEALDAGDVIDSKQVPIERDDHYPELFDKLVAAGLVSLPRAVRAIQNGSAIYTPQADPEVTSCGKISTEMRRIDWNCDMETVYNRIRACAGHRTAWTTFRGNKFLLHRAQPVEGDNVQQAIDPSPKGGTIIKATRGQLCVVCGDGRALALIEVQPENRKRITAADCINGIHLQVGESFE